MQPSWRTCLECGESFLRITTERPGPVTALVCGECLAATEEGAEALAARRARRRPLAEGLHAAVSAHEAWVRDRDGR